MDGDIVDLFDRFVDTDVAMIQDPVEHSYARKHSGRAMYNAGFVLYRRSPDVLSWLAQWISSTEKNFRLAELNSLPHLPELSHVEDESVRRELLRMDQISLMELISPDVNRVGLKVQTLDYEWNYRGGLRGGNTASIKIAHLQDFRARTLNDILLLAYYWAKHSDTDRASLLYDYVADRQRPTSRRWRGLKWIRPTAHQPEEWSTTEIRNADLHLRYGQIDKAFDIFSARLKKVPDDILGAVGLSRVAIATNHVEDAITIAANASAALSDSSYALVTYGRALLAASRPRDAIIPLSKAFPKAGAEGAFQLGLAWFALENYENAAWYFERAFKIDPEHQAAAANLLPALLGHRRYRSALTHANRLLDKRPWNVRALAFKSVALVELGLHDKETDLARRNVFLKQERLQQPNGFSTLNAFHRALAEAFSATELIFEPNRHTAKKGFQSKSLAESKDPAIRGLNELILAAVDRRRTELVRLDKHPFVNAIPRTYYLNSWAVVLDEGGHQTPHIHPNGWLSGVYYVDIPAEITRNDPQKNGWLSFGRSEERWYRKDTAANTESLCPEPGMLVTFPSFYWHQTNPLRSRSRRISYAFDIVPA